MGRFGAGRAGCVIQALCSPRPSWDSCDAKTSSGMEGGLRGMQLQHLFVPGIPQALQKNRGGTDCLGKLCLAQATFLHSAWDALCQPEKRTSFSAFSKLCVHPCLPTCHRNECCKKSQLCSSSHGLCIPPLVSALKLDGWVLRGVWP